MKKKAIIFALIVVVSICFLWVFSYRFRIKVESTFLIWNDSVHKPTEANDLEFETKKIRVENINVYVDEEIYSRGENRKLIKEITRGLILLDKRFSLEGSGDLYIVSERNNPEVWESKTAYITYDDIKDNKYLGKIISPIFGLRGEWKKIAIEGMLKSEVFDENRLKTLLKKESNRQTLQLFPLFYRPEYNSDSKEAKYIAEGYGRWIIKKYGFNEFEKDNGERVNFFFKAYGYKSNFYIDNVFKEVAELDVHCGRKVLLQNNRFTFSYYKNDTVNIEEAYKNIYSVLKVDKDLKKDLNKIKRLVGKHISKYDLIRFDIRQTIGTSVTLNNSIKVSQHNWNTDTFIHELVHAYLEKDMETNAIWLGEGLAEYYALKWASSLNDKNIESQKYGYEREIESLNNLTPDQREYYKKIKEKYEAVSGGQLKRDTFDVLKWECCIAAYTLLNKNTASEHIEDKFYLDSLPQLTSDSKLDSLTYPECCLLVEYLVDTKQMKKVMEFHEGIKSMNAAFGQTEDELYDSFVKWVKKKYAI